MSTVQHNVMVSVVVPVYKEEGNVEEFLRRVVPVLESVTRDFEVIFTLDPSPDQTEQIILKHRGQDNRVKLLVFSRRVGQPMATLAGLHYARGEAVIVMDVDLQDPPELIPQMVAKWREGYEVVIPQRTSRAGETLLKRLVVSLGYGYIRRISHVDMPSETGDFRLLGRRAVEEIIRLPESHGFLRGLTALVGFRQALVPFERPARFAGAGNYNRFLGDLRIGFNGVFCFSNRPLSIATQLGFAFCALAVLGAVVGGGVKLTGHELPVRDTTLLLIVLFLGGVQLVSVGILGEYIGRIYDEVKRRPKFIVDRAIGFEQTTGKP